MAINSIPNSHAQHERDLANTIAQESLRDLYGGEMKTYNGPGCIAGLVFIGLLVGSLVCIAMLLFGG